MNWLSQPCERRLAGREMLCLSLVISALGAGVPAQAASNEELAALIRAQRAELQALRREVDALKRDKGKAAVVVQPAKGGAGKSIVETLTERFVEKGKRPKSFKVPGTEFDVRIGGFAKGDYITRISGQSSGAEDLFVVPATLTRGGRGTDDRARFHGRETRLFVDVAGPTRFGNFRALVEGDFFGFLPGGDEIASNSASFRLRHAYGEIGPLGFGQFWSTFSDPSAYSNTLDFQGTGGETFIRQGLVKYTHSFGNGFSLAAAAENPESRVILAGAATATSFRDTNIPDFVLRARYEQPWGHVQAAALVSNVAGPAGTGSEIGFGATVSGKINVPLLGEKDNLVFQGVYSHGAGRYILDSAVASGSAAVVPGTTRLEIIDAFSGYVGYQHFWLPELRSTVAGSYVFIDTPDFLPATAFNSSIYAIANLIWSPFPEVDLGVEVQWGQREDKDGAKGTATRLQSSAIFRF